jgi:hypothetical protein
MGLARTERGGEGCAVRDVTVWVVVGGLGSGKSLQAVAKMRDALMAGRRVATNMDLRIEKMVTGRKPRDVYRLPDFPTMDDLKEMGCGYGVEGDGAKFDEKKFGLIVLDEAAGFLNSREYQGAAGTTDKDERRREAAARMKLVLWLRHARKYRWHLILIVQDAESLDAQVRRALCDNVVDCRRLDSFNVPIISTLTKSIGLGGVKLPQVHLGVVRYKGTKSDTWWLPDARWLHGAYETQQKIVGDIDGPAIMLDAAHAPYMWEPSGWREKLRSILPGFFRESLERQRHDDFRLFEAGLTRYTPRPVSYAEWLAARRVTAPEGGPAHASCAGGEGEAARCEDVRQAA